MRWVALLRGVLVIAIWVAGAVLTVATGALLNSWWVLPVPLVIAVAVLPPLILSSDECFSCSDEGWNLVSWVTFLFFVVPATVTLALGVAGRRLAAPRG